MTNENMAIERNHDDPAIRILFAVTSPLMWGFYKGIIRMMKHSGFDPFLVSSAGEELQATALEAGVRHAAVSMNREISPVRDLVSLWRLFRVIQRVRPTITNAGTPKAGLLVGLAAWSLAVPCRIYTLHGLRLETTVGLKRLLLITTERLACASAHRVISVSPSLRRKALELKLVAAEKIVVCGSGSFGGIDVHHFSPNEARSPENDALVGRLGIPSQVPVIGFVGRFTHDKGICELIAVFSRLRQFRPTLWLLLVGEFEDGDALPAKIRNQIETGPNIVCTGRVSDTAPYYGLMDILVLPTHREGLSYVLLEAQACGVPVVSTTATGAIDSVVDGQTGFTVPVGDVDALATRVEKLLCDPELRARMGLAGRDRIVREFRQDRLATTLIEQHRSLIQDRTLPKVPKLTVKEPHRGLASRDDTKAQENEMPHPSGQSGLPLAVKRTVDLLVAFTVLVTFSPLLLGIGGLLFLAMGRPIFFRQQRPGRYGRSFTLYKFRTMNDKRDTQGQLLPDRERLTRVGRLLRVFSVDELPQLWNVLRGDLSVVGPRPLLQRYLELYSPEQARRHNVLPGITGWAQINGRNAITWNRKFELDVWYADHWSLWLDAKILVRTIWKVLSREGVSQPGVSTVEYFKGNTD